MSSHEDVIAAIPSYLHQQLPWQDENWFGRISRYARIVNHCSLKRIIENEIKISIPDFYALGLAVAGSLAKSPCVDSGNYALTPGIAKGASERFFQLIAEDCTRLREIILKLQCYDKTWAFTYNPLRGKPLIYHRDAPQKLLGFSQQLLIWRITEGLYYDLPRDREDLNKGFGDSFQSYIGDVLLGALPLDTFRIQEEKRFEVAKGLPRDGADWIVSDATGHVFIECKTKRLTHNAKAEGNSSAMEADVIKLSECFVQNYQNIYDARCGANPSFTWRGLPMFNCVVTLENWRIKSPTHQTNLDQFIRAGLAKKNILPSVLNDVPYRLLSAQELELVAQDTTRHGVVANFALESAVTRGPYKQLFPSTLPELLPEMSRRGAFTEVTYLAKHHPYE
ncbi:hypothetical protein BG57_21145 [Caballeronia grimmiae]|uniref:Uncharacterized protein n=2 Tax=Caballeronia grimmiae TaxID=1071679 RepID=A0A069PG87_9BURK|nr:hypothetical protein BG57_21145 [Caballeronia grimmiae]